MSTLTLGLLAWLLVGLLVAVVTGFFMRDRFVEPETRLLGLPPGGAKSSAHFGQDQRLSRSNQVENEAPRG